MDYLILCIGNPEGGDDAVGPFIAELLKNSDFEVINCETTPENYTGVVKKIRPEILIIIDAVDMGLKPGEIRLVPGNKIGIMHISTHGIPIPVLINYLEQYVNKIFLIGVQPEKMEGELSEIVKKSSYDLVEIIKNRGVERIEILK